MPEKHQADLEVRHIPQYPVTQIPKEQFASTFSNEQKPMETGDSTDFLKRIDEQLRLSQQNYQWWYLIIFIWFDRMSF